MFPTLFRPRPVDVLAGPIGAFEFETQDVIRRTTPYSEHAILHAVAAMLALAVVLMCIVRVERIVVGNEGRIVPIGGSVFIQPLDKAMVSAIHVRAGDVIKQGQVLADLDPTFATADFQQLKDKVDSQQALVTRLEDEQAGRPYRATDPNDHYQALQAAIWAQRQTEYRQSVQDFDSRIASDRAALAKATDEVKSDVQHLTFATQMEQMQRQLAQKGYGSPALVIGANDTRVGAERQLTDSRNSAVGSSHDMASLQAQKGDYTSKWRDDLGTALVQARNDLTQNRNDFAKAARTHDLTKLTAPTDAVVVSIAPASVGSVVDPSTASTPLFTLTPLTGPLEAEMHVSTRDVAFMRPGDKVRLKLDAYRYTFHGVAHGVVKAITEGSFTTLDNGSSMMPNGQPVEPYVKVRVRITDVRLRNVPADFRLIPGMTLSGDVVEGSRTIMSYILEGALRTGSEAMREP